ncbi:hypothetical protein N175_17155 [Vibrio anguillarum M3]|nr:hypothetical protein N175_17155 [Vibrio anguillarum M3]
MFDGNKQRKLKKMVLLITTSLMKKALKSAKIQFRLSMTKQLEVAGRYGK